nr:Gfo/Idh/MocA family oxidoreductase [Acidobacteriota bacterium]
NRGELQNPEWTGDTDVTGGFLYETTIHLFDMMRFQFGEVAEMLAFGSSHTYPETDNFSVLLKFKSGLHATFSSAADASWIFPFERVEAFCEHRTIMTQEMENLTDSRGTDPNFQFFSWHLLSKEERWGYQQENEQFIDSILNETEPPVTAFDGYKSVELVEACYKAVKSGERIVFE